MAFYKQDIVDVNLETGVIHRSFLNHTIGHKDADANRFGIRAFRNGDPVDLSGAQCQAVFMAPDGTNIALTSYGTVSGNEAYVTLPQACYNVEGQFCLAIKLVGGDVTATVRIIDGVVDRTGATGAVAPTDAVPTYQEILAVYAEMQEDVADYESVVATQNGKIDDLKSAFIATMNPDTWEPNITKGSYFKAADGSTGSSNKYARTGFWYGYKRKIAVFLNNSTYECAVAYYDETGSASGTGYLGHDNYGSGIHLIPEEAIKFGVSFRRADQAVLSDADITAILAALSCYTPTDTSLTKVGTAADAQAVGNQFAEDAQSILHPMSCIDREKIGGNWDTESSGVRTIKRFNSVTISGIKTTGDRYNFGLFGNSRISAKEGTESSALCNESFVLKAGKKYRISLCIASGNAQSNSNGIEFRVYKHFQNDDSFSYETVYTYTKAEIASGMPNTIYYDLQEENDFSIGLGIFLYINVQYNNIKLVYDIEEVKSNIINKEDFQQGSYSSSTGMASDTTRIRLRLPVYARKGTIVRANLSAELEWYLWEISSESRDGGNLIKTHKWSKDTCHITGNDCFLMMAIRKTDGSNISVNDLKASDYFIVDDNTFPTVKEWERTHRVTKEYLEQGGFTSSEGAIDSDYRIRTKEPLYCSRGTRIKFNIGELYFGVWELSTESRTGGNVLRSYTWYQDEEYEVTNDSWIVIAFATASTSAQSQIISPADFDGYNAQIAIGSEYPSALSVIDEQQKIREYVAYMKGKTTIESFMFFTDSHWLNGKNWKSKVTNALNDMKNVYSTAPVDFCIYGGDAISGTSPYNQMTAETAMYYLALQDQMCRNIFGFDTYYPLVGNHDYNYQAGDLLSETDIVHVWFRRFGKAYYSFRGNETTVYCLNTGLNQINGSYDVPMDDYKWEQIDWLGNALIHDNPAHAFISMHIIINNNVHTEFCLYKEANELCAAYNAHETITKNGITYDFTGCTGKVEMFIGGHLHSDSYYGIKNGITYVTRTTANSTISPTFDLVLCDWTNRIALFKRFGTGNDLVIDLTTGQPVEST